MSSSPLVSRRRRIDRVLSDRVLAVLSAVLLAMVVAALLRGRAHWGDIPGVIWLHLATVMPALALTPFLLVRVKGNRSHRVLGWTWCLLLLATAVSSFAVRNVNPGGFSVIHVISAYTVVMLPWIVLRARAHNVAGHRRSVRGMVIGALLIAGGFTFPFGRMLGTWLTG